MSKSNAEKLFRPTEASGLTIQESQAGDRTHEDHEALCSRCGKCCYKKITIGDTLFITPFPCEYLDTETNACTIYERRHELNPECMNIEDGLKNSAFPADCGYVPVKAPPNYRPPRDDWDWDGKWEEFDNLADHLGVSKKIREMVRARGSKAQPMWVEAFNLILWENLFAPSTFSNFKGGHSETEGSSTPWSVTPALIEFARQDSHQR